METRHCPTSLFCPNLVEHKGIYKRRKKKLQKKGKIIEHKNVNKGYRINSSLSHPSTLLSLFGNLMSISLPFNWLSFTFLFYFILHLIFKIFIILFFVSRKISNLVFLSINLCLSTFLIIDIQHLVLFDNCKFFFVALCLINHLYLRV